MQVMGHEEALKQHQHEVVRDARQQHQSRTKKVGCVLQLEGRNLRHASDRISHFGNREFGERTVWVPELDRKQTSHADKASTAPAGDMQAEEAAAEREAA